MTTKLSLETFTKLAIEKAHEIGGEFGGVPSSDREGNRLARVYLPFPTSRYFRADSEGRLFDCTGEITYSV